MRARKQELHQLKPSLGEWDLDELATCNLSTELIGTWLDYLDSIGVSDYQGYLISDCVRQGIYVPGSIATARQPARIPFQIRKELLRRDLAWDCQLLSEDDFYYLVESDLSARQILAWYNYLLSLGYRDLLRLRIQCHAELQFDTPEDLLALQSDKKPIAVVVFAAYDGNGAIYRYSHRPSTGR